MLIIDILKREIDKTESAIRNAEWEIDRFKKNITETEQRRAHNQLSILAMEEAIEVFKNESK